MTDSIGNIGEILVVKYFVELGYEVFTSAFGNSTCDMIIQKDGKLKRVEVKTTSNKIKNTDNKYEVRLKKTRCNTKGATNIPFSAKNSDILVCVVLPTQRVYELQSKDFEGRSNITLEG